MIKRYKYNVRLGMATLNHISLAKLLCFSTLASDFARHGYFSAFGTRLNDESEDTIACTADSQTTKELVLQTLGLDLSVQATTGNALSEQLNAILREIESIFWKFYLFIY